MDNLVVAVLVIGFLLGQGWSVWSRSWSDEAREAHSLGYAEGYADALTDGRSAR